MSLFWRHFLLIGSLIGGSMLAWLTMSYVLEREPRAQQQAWQIVSALNLTRSAVVSAEPMRRPSLLLELARDEGLRISISEASDQLKPLDDTPDNRALTSRLKLTAGEKTKVASAVNGEPGFWVSFDIEGDSYWLGFDADRFKPKGSKTLLGWAALTVLAALAVAAFITKVVNVPLKRLADGLTSLARGEPPTRLPEQQGPSEIRALNTHFNEVSAELEKVESDRAIALAGVSHDIRTPLTRMRMEIEMSGLEQDTQQSLVEEIDRINAIVSQFIEFSRTTVPGNAQNLNLSPLIERLAQREVQAAPKGSTLRLNLPEALEWNGSQTDIERILSNLLTNARRYGLTKNPSTSEQTLDLFVEAKQLGKTVQIAVSDSGAGIPHDARERLLRPFARLDEERSQAAGGSGLGLAIVARLVRRYNGTLKMDDARPTGLKTTITLASSFT